VDYLLWLIKNIYSVALIWAGAFILIKIDKNKEKSDIIFKIFIAISLWILSSMLGDISYYTP